MRKVSIKIAYRFPNQSSYVLPMHSYNTVMRKWQTLYDDGSISTEPPATPKTMVKLVLPSMENFPEKLGGNIDATQFAGKKRPYVRLDYIHKDDEDQIENDLVRLNNMLIRKQHEFIVNHCHAFVPDINGINQNLNMGDSPLVDVIDETMYIRNEKGKNDMINKNRTLAENIFKNDHDTFVDLAYACDIANVAEIGYSESLYNKMMTYIENKPFEFEKVYNSNQRSLLAMINRALYTEVDGRLTAIEQRAGYYMFNNFAICKIEGKEREGLLNYFNANPDALHQLEQKMGIYIPRTELKKLPDLIEVKPKEVTAEDDNKKALKEEKLKEAALRQEVLKLTHTLSRNKNLTTEMWNKYAEDINDIREKNPGKANFIDKTTDDMCKNFSLENPYKKLILKKEEVSNG